MKILFLCPDYFGIHKIIEREIKANMNCELKVIIFKDYKYKNAFQKIKNFFSKLFLSKNLKKIWSSKQQLISIDDAEYFDYLFVICPDFLLDKELKYITNKAKKSIVYYWDSFDNILGYKRTINFFDKKFSFEPKDVQKYNMSLLTNFYYNTERNEMPTNDLYFIGTFDKRIHKIMKVVSVISKYNINIQIFLISGNKKNINKYQTKNIKFLENPISFKENEKLYNDSKIILDIQKPIQKGLTFRVFEAIGKGKKLITTNADIVNYDFYNSNNIFIFTDETKEIPLSFFLNEYQKLPIHIYEKYSVKNWIKTIFNIQNN